MTAHNLRPLDSSESERFIETFSLAFFDDPLMTYIFPDESSRMAKSNWMFSAMIGYCQRWGKVYTTDDLMGGSVWLDPGNTTMTTMRLLRSGFWKAPFKMGMGAMMRFNKLDGAATKAHKRAVSGEHWYLLGLGTHPDSQGTGIGSAAIEVGGAQAAGANLPVYLETMTDSNVEYYTKRGFKVAEEVKVEDGLKFWTMVRQP